VPRSAPALPHALRAGGAARPFALSPCSTCSLERGGAPRPGSWQSDALSAEPPEPGERGCRTHGVSRGRGCDVSVLSKGPTCTSTAQPPAGRVAARSEYARYEDRAAPCLRTPGSADAHGRPPETGPRSCSRESPRPRSRRRRDRTARRRPLRRELGEHWTVGPKRPGGLLLVLLVRAALARLDADAPGLAPDPLAIAADFLRAPDPRPVTLTTEVSRRAGTASVVAVRMHQDDRLVLAASVTAGRLPDADPRWSDAREPARAPRGRHQPGGGRHRFRARARPATCASTPRRWRSARRSRAPPVLRGLGPHPRRAGRRAVRPPRGRHPAADGLQPRRHAGWAPPCSSPRCCGPPRRRGGCGSRRAPSRCAGAWFDEDVAVVDAAGRLVCQARQLALAPLPGAGRHPAAQ
jgi:hypothetical protein